jgi:hypothetical protein
MLSPLIPLSLESKLESLKITFLMFSHSVFSSNKTATHSIVYLTKACGLLFYFISDISPLFNLSNYSMAFCKMGWASFKTCSASAFKIAIFSD